MRKQKRLDNSQYIKKFYDLDLCKLVCHEQFHTNFDNLFYRIMLVKKSNFSFELNDLNKSEFEEPNDLQEFFID